LGLNKSDVGLSNVDNTQQQPLDSDLTAIAALSPSNDDIIQRKAGNWTNRTVAEYKTDLSLGSLADKNTIATSDIDDDTVTNAKLNTMGANTVKVNNTTIDANPTDLTLANSTFLGRTSASDIKGMTITEVKTEIGAGAANGIATLDGSGRIPNTQLPTSAVEYLGTWNASTNTPSLADGVGTNGDEYYVNVAGTQNLGSGNITFAVGDLVRYNGTIWQKLNNDQAVTSVFNRTGAITSANGDYIASQITYTPSGGLSSTTVQAAIDELESEKQSALTNGVQNLTTSEVTQLANIDSNTISNTQWGYLGSSDQGIATYRS